MNGCGQRGFSLLELLVALFVVVIITSLVTLAVNSGGRGVELDGRVRSLADVASYALDEAQMRGVDMGLLLEEVDREGERVYRFRWLERTPRGWRRPAIDADIFRSREFPPDIELTLQLEDTLVDMGGKVARVQGADQTQPELEPQVVFYSSGEVTTGSITVRERGTGELLWLLEWDLLGRFTLLPRGEAGAN